MRHAHPFGCWTESGWLNTGSSVQHGFAKVRPTAVIGRRGGLRRYFYGPLGSLSDGTMPLMFSVTFFDRDCLYLLHWEGYFAG